MYLIYFFAAHGSVKPDEQTGSVLQDQHRLMVEYFPTVTLKVARNSFLACAAWAALPLTESRLMHAPGSRMCK